MQARQYLLVFFSTTLLVTLTNQSSNAFTVRQNPTLADYISAYYFPNEGLGVTYLNAVAPSDPFSKTKAKPFVSPITLGGTTGLLADLQLYRDEGWTFKRGRNLKGRFDVKRQYACGYLTSCGAGTGLRVNVGGIGSAILLSYIPSTSGRNPDPKPGVNTLFWIQRVFTNYPSDPDPRGVPRSYIDNRIDKKGNNATYPYYGAGIPIDKKSLFRDRPYREKDGSNLFQDYYWTAELYLAEADKFNPQEVTIYNGVRWGWQYKFTPDRKPPVCPAKNISGECTPPPPPPPPPPCNGGSGGGGCARTSNFSNTFRELPQLERDGVEAASLSRNAQEATDSSSSESNDANLIEDTSQTSASGDNFNLFSDSFESDSNSSDFNFFSQSDWESTQSDETDWFENEHLSFFALNGVELTETELFSEFRPDESQSPESVPEPSSIFGLLALGIGGVLQKLKNRKQ